MPSLMQTTATLSAVALLAAGGSAAFAQAPSASPQATGAEPTPATSVAPAAVVDRPDGNEIIVTAQRREEKLKDVPLTVTAFNAAELDRQGATATRDLAILTPGITIQNTGAQLQATIRGVGTQIASGAAESPVSLYVDGVYIASQIFAVFDLVNIDSIQVLKGPQGTLFGRNATGGAILVSTKKPSDTFTGRLTATYGSFDEVRVGGYLSGPIAERVSFSLAAYYRDDKGYTEDALRGTDLSDYQEYNFRGKLLLEPTDRTSITLNGDYGRVEDATGVSIRPIGQSVSVPGAFIPTDPWELALTFDPFTRSFGGGGSVDIEHDFSGVTAKSLTAYRDTNHRSQTDQDRTANPVNRVNVTINENVFTQELTVSSSEPGRFQWLAGAFYFNQKTFNPVFVNGNLLNRSRFKAEAGAGFAEGTYEVLTGLKLTAGVRYSKETRRINQVRLTGNPLEITNRTTFDAWTPRFSILYELAPTTNIYATYSKGFKSGLYNATTFNGAAIDPEKIDSYEIGLKHSDSAFTATLSGFYYDYRDLQLQTRDPNGLALILNATDAEVYGIDGDLTYRVTSELRVRLAGAYTRSEYGNFANAPFFRPAPAGGNIAFTGDATGNPLVRTPKFTGNAAVTYDKELASGDRISASVTYYYNSGFAWSFDNRVRQSDYSLVNAEVGYTFRNSLRVSVWSRNLTDTRYSLGTSVTNFADAIAYARPRSIGVTGTYNF